MKRREFLTVAGAAVLWPLASAAQQPKVPTIGVLVIGDTGYAGVRLAACILRAA